MGFALRRLVLRPLHGVACQHIPSIRLDNVSVHPALNTSCEYVRIQPNTQTCRPHRELTPKKFFSLGEAEWITCDTSEKGTVVKGARPPYLGKGTDRFLEISHPDFCNPNPI